MELSRQLQDKDVIPRLYIAISLEMWLGAKQAVVMDSRPLYSKELRPLLPKSTHTDSSADTISPDVHTGNNQGWTIDSVDCNLPKYSSRCTWTPMQMDSVLKLYSVPDSCMDIPLTCYSYMSVVINGKLFGTQKSRTAASSIVTAIVD